ncbi:MAG: EcsC family protein, partial [Methylocystis sp.]
HIARTEGEDLSDPAVSFACLEVFALGGHGEGEGVFEGGYLALRGIFAKSVSDAASYVAAGGAAAESAPVVARLIAKISTRFGVVVTQKSAAQAAPILGALGGAAVNLAFMEHFETLARGHFTVRRLERAYGEYEVRSAYVRIARDAGYWAKVSA